MFKELSSFFLGERSSHFRPEQFDQHNAELIEIGESRVFKVTQGKILKIYDTELARGIITLSTLKKYRILTNRVSEELSKRSDTWSVSNKTLPIEWRVVKIDELGRWPKTNNAWSISQSVIGTNLRDNYYPFWASRQILPLAILEGQQEQAVNLISKVSKEVNLTLGTTAVDIVLTNVIADFSEDRLIFNVTDVCGIVSKVDGGNKKVPVMFG